MFPTESNEIMQLSFVILLTRAHGLSVNVFSKRIHATGTLLQYGPSSIRPKAMRWNMGSMRTGKRVKCVGKFDILW